MYGSAMGTLHIDISTDSGSTWTNDIWTMSGNQGNAWHQASIGLNSYAGGTNIEAVVANADGGASSTFHLFGFF
jgi:hypothetical protein